MSGTRILVVDDDPQLLKFLVCIVCDLGHCALQANDGIDALRLAEREPVDVVVTDLEMPMMGGVELTRRLRGAPSLRHIPVIAITGGARGPEALVAGCHSVLRKPFGVEDLAGAITRALS